MSVMLELVVPPSPCTPDCPDRSATCTVDGCQHGYEDYIAARNKVYEARKLRRQYLDDANAGIQKAMNKARREKLAHGKRR